MVTYYRRYIAAYGSGQPMLLTHRGETLFSRKYESQDLAGLITGGEHYLAMDFEIYRMREITAIQRAVPMLSPTRIKPYNWTDDKRGLSIPFKNEDPYSPVSPQVNW